MSEKNTNVVIDDAKAREALRAKKELYLDVFGTEQGKLVLADLLEKSHFFNTHVRTEDPENLRHIEGRRFIVGRIVHFTEFDIPDLVRIYHEGTQL